MIEEEVIIEGSKYKPMVLGPAPNPATDVFQDGKVEKLKKLIDNLTDWNSPRFFEAGVSPDIIKEEIDKIYGEKE